MHSINRRTLVIVAVGSIGLALGSWIWCAGDAPAPTPTRQAPEHTHPAATVPASSAPGVGSGQKPPVVPQATSPGTEPADGGPATVISVEAGGPASAPGTGPQSKSKAHVIAPAAIPRHIAAEPDPTRRAELMTMHRLAMARVRVAMLERRRRLLTQTLVKAESASPPNASRIKQLRKELTQLGKGLNRARRRKIELTNAQQRP